MPNFCSITLIGHLGRDVDLKSLADGTTVANFSIATSRKRRDAEVTTWWRAALFGKRGEALAQYLHKGDPVLIQGEAYQRSYTANDGTERTSLEVDVREWAFVGGKGQGNESGGDYQPAQRADPAKPKQTEDFNDDIPF
jgi:single-strand DNA-binding protein